MKNATKFSLFLSNPLSKAKFPKTGIIENINPLELQEEKTRNPRPNNFGKYCIQYSPSHFHFH